jgi:hypothetical protein
MNCKNARSGKFTKTVKRVKHNALHSHANDSSRSFRPTLESAVSRQTPGYVTPMCLPYE